MTKTQEEQQLHPSDIIVNYIVTKDEGTSPKMDKLVGTIISYVQNNEIYFKYEPKFHNGVLLFGIVGFADEHETLQSLLGDALTLIGCSLKTS